MASAPATSYDEIPYSDTAFSYTHPDRLALMALLYGMTPAPINSCRVLELGCALGGNLIPMAQTLPDSSFVGIDLSPVQIEQGRDVVKRIGLTNIDLRALSILDVSPEFGQFDYIICHGVYSWVPPVVQDKILQICRQNLGPQGVAYISYNILPGWHLRGMVRDMLHFHVRKLSSARDRVQQARAFLNFLVESAPDPSAVHAQFFKQEAEMLSTESDTYLFHEHLEDANQPVYFHEFAGRAAGKHLQYLAEAKPSALAASLPAKTRQTIERLADNCVEREQYLDFICNGTFRRTLLCHQSCMLAPAPSLDVVMRLHITGLVHPVTSPADISSDAAVEFRRQSGTSLSTNRPLVKAALAILHEANLRPTAFEDLWQEIHSRLPALTDDRPDLAAVLLELFRASLVELQVEPPRFASQAGSHPLASPLARIQAETGTRVTNLRHRQVVLNDLEAVLLRYLDGRRDRYALLDLFPALAVQDIFTIEQNGQPVKDRAKIREMVAGVLEPSLERLALNALLLK
jgi:methyltransferase-like protein/2-polyprenyl-3-methyl-5-hydroxy-6-metoxy-1,4-benzoquinol methylase